VRAKSDKAIEYFRLGSIDLLKTHLVFVGSRTAGYNDTFSNNDLEDPVEKRSILCRGKDSLDDI